MTGPLQLDTILSGHLSAAFLLITLQQGVMATAGVGNFKEIMQ